MGRESSWDAIVETALSHLSEGDASKALEVADAAVAREPESPIGHELRALALTRLERIDEADAAFTRAAEIDPEEYFRPYRLGREAFDAADEEVLHQLPGEYREYLQNVEVGVEDTPPAELLAEDVDYDDLGLYIGGTAAAEDWDFPDRVILFQRNLENISPDRETLLEEIRDTVLHEVGHHFGMDEDTLQEIENEDDESEP